MKVIRLISYFILLFAAGTLFISCDKRGNVIPMEPPVFEGPDTVVGEETDYCTPDSLNVFTFAFEGKIYHFTKPAVKVWTDTIYGESIFLPDSIVFYERNIVIEKPLNDNQDILITIKDVKDPRKECLPLMEYFPPTYYYYENDLNYCFQPNPAQSDKVIPLCSSARITLRTRLENGTGYSYAHDGSLEINRCEKGFISGRFENKFFTNGHFCGLDIRQ